MEGHAAQHVSNRNAEYQSGNEPADEQCPIPPVSPPHVFPLRSILEAYGTQDECEQDGEHREIEAGKRNSVKRGPRRKDRPASEDQPNLVALPRRPDAVDHDATLDVRPRHEWQQGSRSQIETVSYREPDEQDSEQKPPDDAQRFV